MASEEALCALQQQFTTAIETLSQQSQDLRAELARSREASAGEMTALRAELQAARGPAPARQGAHAQSVGVDTRLLGKPSDFSGDQHAWRDWSAVFKGYAGAAIPRLQGLMKAATDAEDPCVNATVLDEEDRAASAQLYWMLLMICKGRP